MTTSVCAFTPPWPSRCGIDPERIFKGRNGLTLEFDESGARLGREIPAGMIFVDGVDIGDPDDVALRDRRALSADGVFIVVATISSDDGSQVAPPEIIFRGVPFLEEADGLVEELRDVVAELADQSRRGTRSARRRCSSRTFTTTSPGSSMTAFAGGRWCCR